MKFGLKKLETSLYRTA